MNSRRGALPSGGCEYTDSPVVDRIIGGNGVDEESREMATLLLRRRLPR